MPKPMQGAARIGLYAFLLTSAAFFLIPVYIMLITSFKTMPEIREAQLFSLPAAWRFDAWIKAWGSACIGMRCEGIHGGFANSLKIMLPSVALSVLLGSLNGYALALWNVKRAEIILGGLMLGAFIPYQVLLYPLVLMTRTVGVFGSLPGVIAIHVLFGLPVLTLIFRNYYVSLPGELVKAARVDGAGFFRIYFHIMLPLSPAILIVAVILQVNGVWNDYLFGLIFAGNDNLPMTVQLNNLVNSTFGEKEYNVNMAATMLTAAFPLLVYFFSGRYFVRGITSGAVKG